MLFSLAPAPIFELLARIYAFIAACSAISFAHPKLRSPQARPVRQAINSWWPPALTGGIAVAFGPWATLVVFAGISAWTLNEYLRAQGDAREKRLDAFGYLTVAIHFAAIASRDAQLVSTLWVGWAFGVVTLASLSFGGPTPMTRAARLQLGLVWTVFAIGHVPWLFFKGPLGGPTGNAGFILLLFTCVMTSDAAQYVAGKALGRHKLAPVLSPKKTWEGLVGGMAITALVGSMAAPAIVPFTRAQGALMGALLSGLGLLGDLTVSGMKRELGLKDTGAVLPGQGGLLDRCDSLLIAAPVYCYLVQQWFG